MTDVRTFSPMLDSAVRRATLLHVDDDAAARVLFEDDEAEEAECDLLYASSAQPRYTPGDTVLVWRPAAAERGVILGRIGPASAVEAPLVAASNTPDELTLEARHLLTLRVGAGSITIREDGRILIKGKDLVSHAQRLNRIKGGAVAIN
jgi:hypothetical protein